MLFRSPLLCAWKERGTAPETKKTRWRIGKSPRCSFWKDTPLMHARFTIYCEKNTDSVSKDEKTRYYSRNFPAGTADGRAADGRAGRRTSDGRAGRQTSDVRRRTADDRRRAADGRAGRQTSDGGRQGGTSDDGRRAAEQCFQGITSKPRSI